MENEMIKYSDNELLRMLKNGTMDATFREESLLRIIQKQQKQIQDLTAELNEDQPSNWVYTM